LTEKILNIHSELVQFNGFFIFENSFLLDNKISNAKYGIYIKINPDNIELIKK
jgi:parallel beta-helix repeat protein